MSTLDTLCEKLIKTYNTTIIDQMPPVLQQALYSNAFACSVNSHKQHEKDRTVLAELIYNHFTKKAAKQQLSPSYIGGPRTLTCHWSETYQKLIYIFGETHKEYTDCFKFPKNQGFDEEQSGMPIETYLKNLTEINDIFLDIFIEISAYKPKNLKYSTPLSETKFANLRLSKIGTEFAACMDGTDRNIKNCSRSRIHYIDIRNIEDESHESLDPISNFIESVLHILSINNTVSDNQRRNALLSFARSDYGQYVMNGFSLAKDNPNFLDFWNSMISNNYYVQKELDNCDKQMTETISNFIKKEIQLALDAIEDNENQESNLNNINTLSKFLIENTDKIDDLTIIQYFNALTTYAIGINFVIVDCYILCRIFKKFNLQPENPQKRRSTDEPETPSNIIIYAGDDHCNIYRKFLKEIGFTLIANIGSRNPPDHMPRNCIDMTMGDSNEWSLQPLFSAWPPPIQPYLLLQQAQAPFGGFGTPPQQTTFGGFGTPPQQTTFGGFGLPPQATFGGFGLPPPQQTTFGGFGLPPAPKQLSKQEEEQKNRLLYEKRIIEEDTVDGNVGKMNTRADLNRKARKNKQY